MATKTAHLEEELAVVDPARVTEPPADEGVVARSFLPHFQRCSHVGHILRDHRNAWPRRTHGPWRRVPAQGLPGKAVGRLEERAILLETVLRAMELARKVLPHAACGHMLVKGGVAVCFSRVAAAHLPLAVGAWRGKHHGPVAFSCVGVVPADTKGRIPAALCWG